MANLTLIFAEGAVEPTAFGMNATVWVSIAMLVFLGILVWKGVPAAIAAMLDKRIAEIAKQLTEAEQLRLDIPWPARAARQVVFFAIIPDAVDGARESGGAETKAEAVRGGRAGPAVARRYQEARPDP